MSYIILVIPTDFIQKHYNLYTEPKPNLKTVVEYFRDKENRQDVQFVNRSEPEHPGFVIRLNQRQVYRNYRMFLGILCRFRDINIGVIFLAISY